MRPAPFILTLLAGILLAAVFTPAPAPFVFVRPGFQLPVFFWRAGAYHFAGWQIEWRTPEGEGWSRYLEVRARPPAATKHDAPI